MNKQSILESIGAAYDHATTKHPCFATQAMQLVEPETASRELSRKRELLKHAIEMNTVDGSHVLECELAEAMEAYSEGRVKDCIEELYQCAAVIMRLAEMTEKESQNK